RRHAGSRTIRQAAAIYGGVSQGSAVNAGRIAAEGTSRVGRTGPGEAFENIGARGLASAAERRHMFGKAAQLVRQHRSGVYSQGRRHRGVVLESAAECPGSFRG